MKTLFITIAYVSMTLGNAASAGDSASEALKEASRAAFEQDRREIVEQVRMNLSPRLAPEDLATLSPDQRRQNQESGRLVSQSGGRPRS